MKNKIKTNKGFSLIELLIAVALLSIVMIMVTQFMSTSSWALTKTKKNLNIQTEAIEIGSNLSDALVQATYIRVRTQNSEEFTLDATLLDETRMVKAADSGTYSGDLVVDNYPNYLKAGVNNRKIILDESNYKLIDEIEKKPYPILDGDEDQTSVESFRRLTRNKVAGKPLYVKPEFIYVQYQKKDSKGVSDAYVIFYFVDNKIYMDRGDVSTVIIKSGADGFEAAKNLISGKISSEEGLLTEHVKDYYFSADTDANTLYLNMLFEDKKFEGYLYNYAETILLRNSNVLTVPPQDMYKVREGEE